MPRNVEESPYYLRITATPNCNFRCPYCNPEGTFTPGEMSDSEVLDSLRAARANNISKIHWTGGEPTIRKGMVNLVAEATKLGFTYQAITTNGLVFNRDIEKYKAAGLTGASISLDSLRPERVEVLSGGRKALKPVYNAIVRSCDLFPEVVVNTVVTPTNFDEIPDFIEFARKMDGKFIPRFCELQNYGPAYGNQPEKFKKDFISRDQIYQKIKESGDLAEVDREEVDKFNANAEYIRFKDGLTVGIIAPYTNGWPCAGENCGRIRIGPTGIVKSCVQGANYELGSKSLEDKEKIFERVIFEKDQRKNNNNYPAHHVPAYNTLRFGLKKP